MVPQGKYDPSILSTTLGPVNLASPFIAASGTFGYGSEFDSLADLKSFGAITLKAVSIEPRKGTNLVGDRVEDYVKLAGILDGRDELTALEINGSCPNVEHGFLSFAADPVLLGELVAGVRSVAGKPLIAKLSPNVTDILPLARAAMDSGADILNLGNTFLGMSINIDTFESRLSRDYAGLSGRAIRPLAVWIVRQVASQLEIPVIGTGGIYETSDAIEFLIAGASALGLGTVNFIQPNRVKSLADGVAEYLGTRNMSLLDLAGAYKGPSGSEYKQ
jgi:dihydroorotate dehydrogenase (NAD+) catalytic subunit